MGNISKRDGDNCMLIKPSGVLYPQLNAMVRVRLSGECEGPMKPSTDTTTHLAIYNNLPMAQSIVHTHSPCATAFALQGEDIPCVLTEMADEFGGSIPCTDDYLPIGDDSIGLAVADMHRSTGRSTLLVRGHGVFCIGRSIERAVQAAIMAEHAARVCLLAMNIGPLPELLPLAYVKANHERYQNDYGQGWQG